MRILSTPSRLVSRLFPHRWGSALVTYVFLLFLAIGFVVHSDYGVSADEPALRKFGNDVFAYLFQSGPVPTEQDWGFYNPVVQVVMRGVELARGLTDGADIWFLRHLLTFLMFFCTVAAFYRIAQRRFEDWKLPLLGSVMFFLSPRVFAHGFYNPKDVPAMFLFTLSIWTLLIFFGKKNWRTLLSHIICTAVLIGVRPFGWMLPVFAMVFLWAETHSRKDALITAGVYFLTLALALALSWPLLWYGLFNGLIGALVDNTSRVGGGFYLGESISAAGVPWHYLPVWIAVTTPVVYSLFFLIGFGALWIRCARNPLSLLHERPVSGLALLLFSLPMAALLILSIGIFDEWRHMLFLYPAFLLIALEGIAVTANFHWQLPWTTTRYKCIRFTYGLLMLQLISTCAWMLRNHPFEYAYFSIPTRFIDGKFELDYWGLSYRAGLEWIIENESREHINVYVAARVGKAGADTLPLEDWNRLYFVDAPENADYVLDNFRGNGYRHAFPEEEEVYAVTVDEMKILAVYSGIQYTRGTLLP